MNFNLDLTDERWDVRKEASNRQQVIEGRDYVRYVVSFKNSEYGVSIIKNYGSYGYEDDLWEIALLHNGHIYEGIMEDFCLLDTVIGYLDDNEVKEWIEKFYNLYILKDSKAILRSKIDRLRYEIDEMHCESKNIDERIDKATKELSEALEEALH